MTEANELARVIDLFFPLLNSNRKLPAYKLKTLQAIQHCRTNYMGGHIEECQDCGKEYTIHNSCRNRHCPKCGAIDKEKWIIARETDLLPVKYFHVVFTVPDKLNALFLCNQQIMYNLLFSVSSDTLKDFGNTKKWIGGKIGAVAILHTCGQNLQYHPHIHFIVPAGALMTNQKWKHARNRGRYLFKVESLSVVFRARFVEKIRELSRQQVIHGDIPQGLFDNDWVVYAKKAFGGPSRVLKYLGRYTHRTAISNNRILQVNSREVTFSWKDYRKNYAKQITTLPGEEFLRLFALHILPPGFTRIRHYGFLSSAAKTKSLAVIRKDLKTNPPAKPDKQQIKQLAFVRMGINPGICKHCGGNLVIAQLIPNCFHQNQRAPPAYCLEKNNLAKS